MIEVKENEVCVKGEECVILAELCCLLDVLVNNAPITWGHIDTVVSHVKELKKAEKSA